MDPHLLVQRPPPVPCISGSQNLGPNRPNFQRTVTTGAKWKCDDPSLALKTGRSPGPVPAHVCPLWHQTRGLTHGPLPALGRVPAPDTAGTGPGTDWGSFRSHPWTPPHDGTRRDPTHPHAAAHTRDWPLPTTTGTPRRGFPPRAPESQTTGEGERTPPEAPSQPQSTPDTETTQSPTFPGTDGTGGDPT